MARNRGRRRRREILERRGAWMAGSIPRLLGCWRSTVGATGFPVAPRGGGSGWGGGRHGTEIIGVFRPTMVRGATPSLTLPHKGGGNYLGLYLNSFSCPPKVGMGVSVPNASDSSSHQPKQPDSRGSSPAMTRRATLELAPIKAAPPSRIRVSGSASSGDRCGGPNNCSRRHARG